MGSPQRGAALHLGPHPPTVGSAAIAHDTPLLAGIEAFAGLAPDQLRELETKLEPMTVAGGTELVRQGQAADALFLVVSGRFEVLVAGRRGAVAEIGVGSPIGEIAFFAGGTRTATVRALRDSLVLKLSRQDFEQLVARYPQMWTSIAAALARRLAATTAGPRPQQSPRPRTLAICRAGRERLDRAFVRALRGVLEKHASTIVLDSSSTRSRLGPVAGRSLEAGETAWFNELEGQYEYVLYLCDEEPTEWSLKAIRQADMVLAVARHDKAQAAAEREPNALEQLAVSQHKPENVRLVLLHEHAGLVQGTRCWLDARQGFGMHHHVAHGGTVDYERLYRFIAGKALGLVAAGGGAFCASHIGFFEAFSEAGLAFDIVGGTSGGAAMTAAFAMGSDPDTIERRTREMFVDRRALRRWTWPRYSLLDHSELDRSLAAHFEGVDIEDLWIPFFAISTNLSRNAVHCHRRGSLWQAIRASCAIPALLPPMYTDDGEMLVDGCLADNVPLKAMRALKAGPNIVVDFKVPEPERSAMPGEPLPGRHELIRAMLTRSRRERLPKAPGPAAVLLRALMLNRVSLADALGPEDVLLEPEMPAGMSHLDWHRHGQLRREAHAFARARLAELRKAGHAVFDGHVEPALADPRRPA